MLDERWGETEGAVADALRALLAKECTAATVREAEAAPDGRAPRLEHLLTTFGLDDLPADPAVLAAAAWELGRALAPVPFVETATVRAGLGLDRALAYGLEGPVPASVNEAVVARDDGSLVIGVVDAASARRTAAGELVVPLDAIVRTDEVVGSPAEADRLRRLVRLLGAARVVGAGEGLLALGVDYVKRREQFGRPIGAFQAVAFRLVDAAIAIDGAALLARKAAWVADAAQGGDGAPSTLFATMAWAQAVDASRLVATNVHQCMGGYGFALEYDCQLASRRIRSWAMHLGPTGGALADVARELLEPARRDALRWLWHRERGVDVPRWAQELDGSA